MKKDHSNETRQQNPPAFDLFQTFSGMMNGAQSAPPKKQEPKTSGIPEGYANKKFEKLILEHDRISREIDRKYKK